VWRKDSKYTAFFFAKQHAMQNSVEHNDNKAAYSRLPTQIDFCAHSSGPVIHIRNAWQESVALGSRRWPSGRHTRPLPVGTAVALVFGEEALLCSLRPTPNGQPSIYARMLPAELALQEDIGLDPWPQWRRAGNASDYFAFDKAPFGLPWRWDFRHQGDALVIMPTAQPLGKAIGLQVSRPFEGEPLLELHPYYGTWVPATTYFDRHPPAYPQHPDDAWGWLLPTAPCNLEIEGFRFKSVWDYAANPILRAKMQPKESILERLDRATQRRLDIDHIWRDKVTRNLAVLRMLAGNDKAEVQMQLYYQALLSLIKPPILNTTKEIL
jgi:hypothetical protein